MVVKLCECGCGKSLSLSKYTDIRYGAVKGQPLRFLLGHNAKGMDRKNKTVIDLTGKTFGALTVLGVAFRAGSNAKYIHWWTLCKCGKKKAITGGSLRNRLTRSCGCGLGTKRLVHGGCVDGIRTTEYALWMGAKKRAKDKKLPFTIDLHDVVIPKSCPVLGLKLKAHHTGKPGVYDNSPTLDRIVPRHGYTKKNTWVISGRANKAKSNLSLQELELLVKALRKRIKHGH